MQPITIQFTVRVRKDYTRLHVYLGCRCVSDQLGTFGRRRIHWRQNARVEHSLLEKLTLFPNASIVLENVDTHRSTLGRGVNAQTKRRQSHVNAGTVPESENART